MNAPYARRCVVAKVEYAPQTRRGWMSLGETCHPRWSVRRKALHTLLF